MRFAVLGSGSQGNGTLIASADTYVLVDCGFSLRETEKRLLRLGVNPAQLSAILVTHEHADHVHGVGLQAAQGMNFAETFYWDMDDETRNFSQRFFKEMASL